MRFAARTCLERNHHLTCDEEFLVLEGVLRVADIDYRAGDYAYLPAGFPRGALKTDTGCTLLSFCESAPALAYGEQPFDADRLTTRIGTTEADWGEATDPNVVSASVERLLLRPDTPEGDRTWLLRLSIRDGEPYAINGIERHPCVEEMYLLDGDIHMPTGVMRPGAYFWRPPGLAHGPTGTRQGFVALFRAREGHFSTEWSDADTPIAWDAEYDPVIPGSLAIKKRPS
jgi:hypothetical protein